MTTAIRDIEDLFRIFDEYPEQLERFRLRVVGEQLLNLPERFDRFVEEQRQFNDEQLRFNDEMRQFRTEQRRFNDEMRQFRTEQRRFNNEVRRDLGQLRGTHARDATVRRSLVIALRMGLQRERVLTDDDLMAMVKTADTRDIAASAIESFVSADLVMEATDGDGQTIYVAMEISYTANRRDTGRAMRNAEFLTRFTGQPARAAVASVRNDPEIAGVIGSGQVYWHEIHERDLEPE